MTGSGPGASADPERAAERSGDQLIGRRARPPVVVDVTTPGATKGVVLQAQRLWGRRRPASTAAPL